MGADPSGAISSTETLLRNIQGLLKVAADNARQQERQVNYEKAELKMEILREREMKENIERQLMDEQKIRVLYQKRLKKERKARRRLQDQLELEMKRRSQCEEALKTTSADTLRMINEGGSEHRLSSSDQSEPNYPRQSHVEAGEKQWNYSGLDLMSGGAAFWQNYSESLAQELENERKSRQQQQQQQQQQSAQQQQQQQQQSSQQSQTTQPQPPPPPPPQPPQLAPQSASQPPEREVKSPLQESRSGYYKNSVLFTSAT